MKRLTAIALAFALCFSLSGCILAIPAQLPTIPEVEKILESDLLYPTSVTTEDHVTGVTTVEEYEYSRKGSVIDWGGIVTVEVYEDGVLTNTYEVQFDEFANFCRIGDTEIENTYDEDSRMIRSVHTENGEVTQIIKREYDENGRIANEAVCGSDEVMVSFDIYAFEGEYGSYATVDHHDANARCFGYSKLSYNTRGWLNQQEVYDLEGNLLSTISWAYVQHTVYSYEVVE